MFFLFSFVRISSRADGSDNKLVIEGSWTFFESSASVARDAITIPLPAPATLMDIYYRHRRWLLKRQLTPRERSKGSVINDAIKNCGNHKVYLLQFHISFCVYYIAVSFLRSIFMQFHNKYFTLN